MTFPKDEKRLSFKCAEHAQMFQYLGSIHFQEYTEIYYYIEIFIGIMKTERAVLKIQIWKE